MEINVKPSLTDLQVANLVKTTEPGAILNTETSEHFDLIKSLLLQFKRVGVRVCLLDEDGYIVRQISSRVREEHLQAGFNDRQLSVITALERVLKHCKEQGVTLIGYSDELVAVPTLLLKTEAASDHARELNDRGVYLGADQLRVD